MIRSLIEKSLNESAKASQAFCEDPKTVRSLLKAADIMIEALSSGHKIITCGNGGSCCDAMHFAEELTGRYRKNRSALPAVAIADPSHITCCANDFGYEYVFSRMVAALGQEGDVLLGISTSGTSRNVVLAAEEAKARGMKVVILTGAKPSKLAEEADAAIMTPPSPWSDRIQEQHIKCIHILIEAIEKGVLDHA